MSLKIHKAQKDHRCEACGRRIPKGHRYYRDYIEDVRDRKTHTNCLEYQREPWARSEDELRELIRKGREDNYR